MVSNEILVLETLNLASQRGLPFTLIDESTRALSLVPNNQGERSLLRDASIRILPADQFGNQRNLKALDKLHLETALQVAADVVVVYDPQLERGAQAMGLTTVAPGRVDKSAS